MTWILPKQLHTLASVLDTQALILDSNEHCQVCEQSLIVRSKVMPLRTWLRKLKTDSWTQHLSGRILKPSLGQSFVEKYLSSLEDTLANHSVQQENEKEQKIQDTSGLTSQMELDSCNPAFAFLKTSKDISALDSEKLSANWKKLVTQQRGEYSQRQKLVRHTEEKESLSWATPNTMDTLPPKSPEGLASEYKHRPNRTNPCNLRDQVSVEEGNSAWPTPRAANPGSRPNGKGGKILEEEARKTWPTPIVGDSHLNNTPEAAQRRIAEGKATLSRVIQMWPTAMARDWKDTGDLSNTKYGPTLGRAVQDLHRKTGNLQESWSTPTVGGEEKAETRIQRGRNLNLPAQVHVVANTWATPQARDGQGGTNVSLWLDLRRSRALPNQMCFVKNKDNIKLNPRWVESLMGIPIGWTMPTCVNPTIIEQMS